MIKTSTTSISTPSDNEIVMSRVFNAPRKLVFQVYNDPKSIPHWWGPNSLTTVVETMDVRPGGKWRFIQRAVDGKEYAFHGEYIEIAAPERIVVTFEFEGMPGHVVTDTLTLEDIDGKTRMTVRSLFQSKEDRDGMLQSGMEEGANESYERLEDFLSKLQ
jgi:uncharacterized protein YndB with AHSA1/START domain